MFLSDKDSISNQEGFDYRAYVNRANSLTQAGRLKA